VRLLTLFETLLTFLKEYSEGIKVGLIILGWAAIPIFNHRLTKQRERTALINDNIEKIESIFQEMNALASKQFRLELQDNSVFYKLINCNQKLVLYCNRLKELDPKFVIPNPHIAKIRKYTTNDKIIEEHGEHTMQRLLYEQFSLIENYPQQY
jgi:hypothetical protein